MIFELSQNLEDIASMRSDPDFKADSVFHKSDSYPAEINRALLIFQCKIKPSIKILETIKKSPYTIPPLTFSLNHGLEEARIQ
jgi:hypothetical protein